MADELKVRGGVASAHRRHRMVLGAIAGFYRSCWHRAQARRCSWNAATCTDRGLAAAAPSPPPPPPAEPAAFHVRPTPQDQGNAAFKAGNFEEAAEHFSAAIDLDPTNHVLYSNRSAAYASLKRYDAALKDAKQTVELKPDWARVSAQLLAWANRQLKLR